MPDGFDALAAVRHAVAVVCEVDPAGLTAETRFADLGADSLARVGIADVVEAEFAAARAPGMRIDDAALGRMSTLGDLAGYVAQHDLAAPSRSARTAP